MTTSEQVAPPTAPLSTSERRGSSRWLRSALLWGPIVVGVSIVSVWQAGLFHTLFRLKPFSLPYPSSILDDLADNVPVLVRGISQTLPAAVTGWLLGLLIGLAIASLVVVAAPRAADRMVTMLSSANAMPIVALAPLLALWIDRGTLLKVIVVTIMVTPTITVYTARGLRNVDPIALELLASYDASEGTVFRTVRLPSALPFVLTAMKSCVVLALIGTIICEVIVGVSDGLGFRLLDSLQAFQAARGWTVLLVISGLGIGWYVLMEALERVLVPWESASRRRE